MTPERFRQIEQLATLVLQQEPSEWKAFLDKACSGDRELRREVESLLAADANAGSFLAEPAAPLVAERSANDSERVPKEPDAAVALSISAVGRYRLQRVLGSGGMGLVYAAHDPELGREVAIKLMRPQTSGRIDPSQGRARLLREAHAMAQLTHPNVIAVYDVGTFGDQVFIAMEYVEGNTLTRWLTAARRTWPDIVGMFVQAGRGLAAAHAKGILHRDFKADNVWVGEDGRARVLDFGLARATRAGDEELHSLDVQPGGERKHLPRDAPVTEPGRFLGTPPYMAPEQLRGEPGDARTDQFSFCAALYQALYGELPFEGETVPALLNEMNRRRIREPPKSSRVPLWLRRVLLRGLSPDRADRYVSMDRLLDELAPRRSVARRRVLLPIASAMSAAALLLGGIEWNKRNAASRHIRSLAVLPLENLSHDPEQDYLAEGMTAGLITALAKIRALQVISQTSVMQYKGTRPPLDQVARELNVDAVVEGTMLRSGTHVRITARLIRIRPEKHLWANSYDGDLENVLVTLQEVARAVADQVQTNLTPQEKAGLAGARPIPPEVYELYVKGRYFWNRRTQEGLKKAIDYFQQAIDKDPNCALAHAGMADAYGLSLFAPYASMPPSEVVEKATAAALRALEIDETLAEAHTALAAIHHRSTWDWAKAEQEFKRAIELDPSYATAYQFYALLLATMGRQEEAIATVKRAQELDPLSLIINAALGRQLYLARRYDQASEQFRKALELDPKFSMAHYRLGQVYLEQGLSEEAIAEFNEARTISRDSPHELAGLAHAYAVSGRRGRAEEILVQLRELSKRRYVPPFLMAIVYSGLKDNDQAFRWLEKAFEEREGNLVYLNVEPRFDAIRSDPRFPALVRRIGLPPR
jgi:serine/threonine protein kinase/tetratricopeptide (TPR) repeat protein